MRAAVFVVLVVASSLIASAVMGQGRLSERIAAYVRAHHELGLFNGTVLVAQDGTTVFADGFGDARRGEPNTVDTAYRIGSVSKQFTAALVLRLAERGELDLDASISAYLPEYPKPQGDAITLDMLLRHASGIPNYTALPIYRLAMDTHEPPADFLARFWNLELDFEPGTSFSYSNSGYYVLGVILERVSGQTLDELLQRELIGPLELPSTGYDSGPETAALRAAGTEWTGFEFVDERTVDESKIFAAGMMYSSAPALLRWTQLLHEGGVFDEPETHLKMTRPRDGESDDYVYGIGIRHFERGGVRYRGMGHGGGLHGFQSSLAHIEPGGWTIVVLCNNGQQINAMADGIAAIVTGGETPMPRMPMERELAQRVEADGIERTRQWFEEVQGSATTTFDMHEGGLNSLGYAYLARSNPEAAVLVFECNASLFPKSANVYDSLGEGLLALGDHEGALKNYRKSLELDPGNTNAVEFIRRIENR
ncbi:MAG: serine hydrolase [Planctomycetota bacterium]